MTLTIYLTPERRMYGYKVFDNGALIHSWAFSARDMEHEKTFEVKSEQLPIIREIIDFFAGVNQ